MKRLFLLLLFVVQCSLMATHAQLYRAIVAQDGSGDYTSIQDAILSIRDYSPEGRLHILVRKGVYEEKVIVPAYKTNITLVGEDRDSTVLIWHDHANLQQTGRFEGVVLGSLADQMGHGGRQSSERGHRLGTFESYTLKVYGEGFECENMTIVNDARGGQAVALHNEADRSVFRHCAFRGFQDTMFNGNARSRQLFIDCYIEGAVDYIFGPATVWMEQCHIHSIGDGCITAASTPAENPHGYVFNRCLVTAAPEVKRLHLGRPWRNYANVLFMNCELPAQLNPAGWDNWNDPKREATARFIEYNNEGEGAATAQRVAWSRQLSAAEAQQVTLDKVFSQSADAWLPRLTPVSFDEAYLPFYDPQTGKGTPYVASTLEPKDLPSDPEKFKEPLFVRLDGVDCTTYVEYVTAARLARVAQPAAKDSVFTTYLQALRYRHSVRGNYATRKHYFSEWISDAEWQGLLQDVTPQLKGAQPLSKTINFMSQNPRFYPQLQQSEAMLNEVKKIEEMLSTQSVSYIPSSHIAKAYSQMQHGDIVVFLTTTAGLDVQHVGFVWKPTPDATPRLMHASSAQKQVVVDSRTIAEYAKAQKSISGIRIVRIK